MFPFINKLKFLFLFMSVTAVIPNVYNFDNNSKNSLEKLLRVKKDASSVLPSELIDDETFYNSTNNIFVDSKYRDEFEQVIDKWCKPENPLLNFICLEGIHRFDQKFNISQWRLDCTKDKRRRVLFHTYWKLEGEVDLNGVHIRMLRLNIMSFLATQNASCSTLVIWLSSNFSTNARKDMIDKFDKFFQNGRLELRVFDFDALCTEALVRKTRFSHSYFCTSNNTSIRTQNEKNVVGFSDLARFFILDLYGGIYLIF